MATTGAFSDYAEDKIAKQWFRNTSTTPPTSLYVAAFTAVPTDAGGGTEVTGGSYARVAMTTGTSGTGVGSAWTVSASNVVTNNIDVNFPRATANWGTIVGYGIYDASSAGNLIARVDQDSVGAAISVIINTNDLLQTLTGSLSFTID